MKILVLLIFAWNANSSHHFNKKFDHDHGQFDQVLKQIVHDQKNQALVDYKLLKDQPQKLNNYLKSIGAINLNQYQKFNSDQKMAFLINAYNAFTLKLIIDNYPLKSIKNIGNHAMSPWKKEIFYLLEENRSLDNIEHVLLLKNFKDFRIHYAVVCASISCPNLKNFAYQAKSLNQQLTAAEDFFLGDKTKNFYDKKNNVLKVSKIFQWYNKDFNNSAANYLRSKFKAKSDTAIEYLEYDWDLNEWKEEKLAINADHMPKEEHM